jgi:uncharacterized protein YecE (DUF72 family)
MKKHGHRRAAELRIGISGWNYPTWRRGFYPAGLPHRRELEYASRQFNSIEINGTFYGLQKPESFRRWYETAPPGFRFAVKGSRFVTHMKKLRDVKTPLANFFASGVLRLDEKLGPILWQFGPQWPLDLGRVEAFLDMLPRTTAEAARLARRHDARVTGRSWTRIDRERPLRYAFEPRHPGWFTPARLRLLRRHRVALAAPCTAADRNQREDLTTDFVTSGSTDGVISTRAAPLTCRWSAGHDGSTRGAAGSRPRIRCASRSAPRGSRHAGTSTSTSTTLPRCTRHSTR